MSTASQKQAVKLLNRLGYSWEGNFYSGFWVAPPESDYEKGMCEAMKKIANSCGKTFSVDIGYEQLPELVDSLVNNKPKPRTETVYEKVHNSESIKAVMNGSKEYWCKSGDSWVHLDMDSPLEQFCRAFLKVEKEIDWKDEFRSWQETPTKSMFDGLSFEVKMGDESKLYLFERDFIEMCHLVASLTEKPE